MERETYFQRKVVPPREAFPYEGISGLNFFPWRDVSPNKC